jgi:hypothetical protein
MRENKKYFIKLSQLMTPAKFSFFFLKYQQFPLMDGGWDRQRERSVWGGRWNALKEVGSGPAFRKK